MSLCSIYAWMFLDQILLYKQFGAKFKCTGANSHGQLGLGFQSEQCPNPQKINIPSINLNPGEITKITGGAGHTIVLDKKGACYSCGWNHRGQLGISSLEDKSLLAQVQIPQNEKIIEIACGWDSSAAISEKGTLFVWGSNVYGQLGLDTTISHVETPSIVSLNEGIKNISMGLRHTAVVTKNGFLLVTGAGNNGQLGLINSNGFPIKQINCFTRVPELEDISDVCCGQYFTIVTTNKGEIIGFGNNKHGQVTIGNNLQPKIYSPIKLKNAHISNPETIMCGWTHCMALTDNKLLSWGRNTYGELGRGENSTQEPDYVKSLINVKQVSIGSEHNIAVTHAGKMYAWGWNEHGNCGNNDFKDVFIPEEIKVPSSRVKIVGSGAGHSLAVIENEHS